MKWGLLAQGPWSQIWEFLSFSGMGHHREPVTAHTSLPLHGPFPPPHRNHTQRLGEGSPRVWPQNPRFHPSTTRSSQRPKTNNNKKSPEKILEHHIVTGLARVMDHAQRPCSSVHQWGRPRTCTSRKGDTGGPGLRFVVPTTTSGPLHQRSSIPRSSQGEHLGGGVLLAPEANPEPCCHYWE